MISWIFSVITLTFIILSVAIGISSQLHVRANKKRLESVFGGYMSCPTGKLEHDACEADRATDEELETQHERRRQISFTDMSGVH